MSYRLSRRDFLGTLLASTGYFVTGYAFPRRALAADNFPTLPHSFRVFLNLEFLGGCDTHGIWLPTTLSRFSALAGRRPNALFATSPDGTLDPGYNLDIGLHPRLAPLMRHLPSTRLVLNCSNAQQQGQTQSHEDAQNIMSLGTASREGGTFTGWKGRLFMNEPSANLLAFRGSRPADSTCDPHHARCASRPPLTVDTFETFKFSGQSFYNGLGGERNSAYVSEVIGRLAALEPREQRGEVEQKFRSALRGTYAAIDDIQQTVAFTTPKHNEYPTTVLAQQLRNVAMLMKRMIAQESSDHLVISIGMGGFDVHDNWLSRIDSLMDEFASAVGIFMDDLKLMDADKNLILMTTTEFGRKIHDNGGGTDHGTSSTTMLMGGLVRGGPSLLFGDIPTATDFATLPEFESHFDNRSIISYVLERFLGFPRESAFPPPMNGQFADLNLDLF